MQNLDLITARQIELRSYHIAGYKDENSLREIQPVQNLDLITGRQTEIRSNLTSYTEKSVQNLDLITGRHAEIRSNSRIRWQMKNL